MADTPPPAPHHFHAVVWIDHREARVFHFNTGTQDRLVIHPDRPTHQVHHKAGSIGAGHAETDNKYLHEIASNIAGAGEILIVGPGRTKSDLVKHLHQHDAATARRVIGVESSDHPSDGQLLAHARAYFHRADRMTSQTAKPRQA